MRATRHRRLAVAGLLTVAALGGAACGGDPSPDDAVTAPTANDPTPVEPTTAANDAPTTEPTTAPTDAPTTEATTEPTTTAPQDAGSATTLPSEAADPVLDAAVTDLAERLGIDAATIAVASDEAVAWSDGSLGCPEPGRSYTQALVDGRRIVLAVDGLRYDYHAAGDGDPFLCPPERAGS